MSGLRDNAWTIQILVHIFSEAKSQTGFKRVLNVREISPILRSLLTRKSTIRETKVKEYYIKKKQHGHKM